MRRTSPAPYADPLSARVALSGVGLCCGLLFGLDCVHVPGVEEGIDDRRPRSMGPVPPIPDSAWGDPASASTMTARQRKAATLRKIAAEYYRDRRYPLACALLQQATETDPEDPRILVERGRCLLKLGRPSEAAEAQRDAIRVSLAAPPAYAATGRRARRSAYLHLYALRHTVSLPSDGSCARLRAEPSCSETLHACSYTWSTTVRGAPERGDAVRIARSDEAAERHQLAPGPPGTVPYFADEAEVDDEQAKAPTEVVSGDDGSADLYLSSDTLREPAECVARCEGDSECEDTCRAAGGAVRAVRCKLVYADACTGVVAAVCQRRDPTREPGITAVLEIRLTPIPTTQAQLPTQ
jgi:hypothetical protein